MNRDVLGDEGQTYIGPKTLSQLPSCVRQARMDPKNRNHRALNSAAQPRARLVDMVCLGIVVGRSASTPGRIPTHCGSPRHTTSM